MQNFLPPQTQKGKKSRLRSNMVHVKHMDSQTLLLHVFTCSIVEFEHIFANADISTDIESYSIQSYSGCRCSHQWCSIKKFYFAIFTGKHKTRLQHRCILVTVAKFLRKTISKNIFEQLLVCGVCVCSCVFMFVRQVPSSPFIKMSYISLPRTETPASTNWEENCMIYGSAKRSYILI